MALLFLLIPVLLLCSCTQAQINGDIRVVQTGTTPNPTNGGLEVFFDGEWGTVSYISSTQANNIAKVACKQLSTQVKVQNPTLQFAEFYSGTAVTYVSNASSPVWLRNLVCTGNELNLAACSNFFPSGSISTRLDIGITCNYVCPIPYSGPYCNQSNCLCSNGACSNSANTCFRCNNGYYGTSCTFFGCSCTSGRGYCLSSTGSSTCAMCTTSYTGSFCSTLCNCGTGVCSNDPANAQSCYCDGTKTGTACLSPCGCNNGTCSNNPAISGCYACNGSAVGQLCDQQCTCVNGKCNPLAAIGSTTCYTCDFTYSGADCSEPCNCTNGYCSRAAGPNGCFACKAGFVGPDCTQTCPCTNGHCSSLPNELNPLACVGNCNPGWTGTNCDVPCSCPNGKCNNAVGSSNTCLGCNPGFYGPNCVQACNCTAGQVCADGLNGNGECGVDGTLRLTGGYTTPNYLVGRLEIFANKSWTGVCSYLFQNSHASVACNALLRQAGITTAAISGTPSYLASSSYPIFLNGVILTPGYSFSNSFCNSPLLTLADCFGSYTGTCSSSAYVNLICPLSQCSYPFAGSNCTLPCTCNPAVGNCATNRFSNGTCGSCLDKAVTGANCDVACACQHGTCNGGPQCATCDTGYYGPTCKNCSCSAGQICSDGITGDGRCMSASGAMRLARDSSKSGRLELYISGYGWLASSFDSSYVSPTVANQNYFCRTFFGASATSVSVVNGGGVQSVLYDVPALTYYAYYYSSLSTCSVTATTFNGCGSTYLYNLYSYPISLRSTYVSCDYPAGCGNNVLETGEQCDGGANCNSCNCLSSDYAPRSNTIGDFFVGCAPVPRDCTWNDWAEWTACTSACGSVQRQRTNNPPVFGGKACSGSNIDYRNCDFSECFVTCPTGKVSLNNCASKFTSSPPLCYNAPGCPAFPSATCLPDPCNTCAIGYFVNGIKVDCTVRTDVAGGNSNNGIITGATVPPNVPTNPPDGKDATTIKVVVVPPNPPVIAVITASSSASYLVGGLLSFIILVILI